MDGSSPEKTRLSWSQPITAGSAVKSTSSNNSTATLMKKQSAPLSMYGMSIGLFFVSWNCVRHIAHYPSLMGGWWSIVGLATLILALVLLVAAVGREFFPLND